jgi:glutaredoxin
MERMSKELVMYARTAGCPFVTLAKRVLKDYQVAYREINMDQNPDARQRVLDWTGFLSVPTLIVANTGEDLPYAPEAPLEKGRSPRGIDRGTMITEPSFEEFSEWLLRHGFISEIVPVD